MSTPLDNAILRAMAEAVTEMQLFIESQRVSLACPGCNARSSDMLEQRTVGLCRALYALTGSSTDWWWEQIMDIARQHRPERGERGLIIKRKKQQAMKELLDKARDRGVPTPVGECKRCGAPVWSERAQYCSQKCRKAKAVAK